MFDVIICGAGPAGSVAATVLARGGARVLMLDRARFPRDKLCGDTINPGACALLDGLGLLAEVERAAIPIDGMVVTGESGVRVRCGYGAGTRGLSIVRRDLDQRLASAAVAAGARFEDGVLARGPLLDTAGTPQVRGVIVAGRDGRDIRIPAPLVIAADGRRSRLAIPLGLARQPSHPRRWAIGGYFEGVAGLTSFGEMHVRRGHYIGVAPVPSATLEPSDLGPPTSDFGPRTSGLRPRPSALSPRIPAIDHRPSTIDRHLANVCLVVGRQARLANPALLLVASATNDPLLRDRFTRARLVTAASVIGPLAVDATAAGMPGLLLAGDAAGFIDPMTGDGLRFAIRGGELAAAAALSALTSGLPNPYEWLARERQREFASKWRFNRSLRRIVDRPVTVSAATFAGRAAPWILERTIAFAGDVPR